MPDLSACHGGTVEASAVICVIIAASLALIPAVFFYAACIAAGRADDRARQVLREMGVNEQCGSDWDGE